MSMENSLFLQAENALASARKAPSLGSAANEEKARQVAEDFESVFLSQLLKNMFTSVQVEAPFGGGHAEEMWRSLQVDEYGKMITKTGGIGVADAVFKEMLKMQEAS
jgi:peptidoglycan hydrolase FlgJ